MVLTLLNLTGMPFNVICTVVEDTVKMMVSPNGTVDLTIALVFQTLVATFNPLAAEKISKVSLICEISATKSMFWVVWKSSEINSKGTLFQ